MHAKSEREVAVANDFHSVSLYGTKMAGKLCSSNQLIASTAIWMK